MNHMNLMTLMKHVQSKHYHFVHVNFNHCLLEADESSVKGIFF